MELAALRTVLRDGGGGWVDGIYKRKSEIKVHGANLRWLVCPSAVSGGWANKVRRCIKLHDTKVDSPIVVGPWMGNGCEPSGKMICCVGVTDTGRNLEGKFLDY